ncbi:DUF1573 domain-containing protein [Candidatus Berkelbacteria bacterium]|nr:DUF1573 domain-containing protein [Candidatus Berkelbacteria bacterium]
MNRFAWIVLGIVTVGLLGGIVWYAGRTGMTTSATAYQAEDPARPVVVVEPASFDFGTINAVDEQTKTVTLRNDGQSPLEVTEVTTSCDCTFATIALPDGTTSPEFTMHGRSNWSGTIAPGESATVTIIYRPAVMPVTGTVSRGVNIRTNDPVNPVSTIGFEATVQ